MTAKTVLLGSNTDGADTSTLGTQLSSLSVTDESSASNVSMTQKYQVFILAGHGHKYAR